MIRIDGRSNNQIRPYDVEFGFIKEATGSTKFQQGSTSVIVSVNGPRQPKYSRYELYDRASVDLSMNFLDGSDSMRKLRSTKLLLLSSLTSAIDVQKYPRMLIYINVEVIEDDGSFLSTAFNACIIALLDSGIQMKSTPIAASVALTSKQNFILDPTHPEETESIATILVISVLNNKKEENLLQFSSNGQITNELQLQSIEFSYKYITKLRYFICNLFHEDN